MPLSLDHELTAAITRHLGPTLLAAFGDRDVTEIYANPDGSLWFDTHSKGRTCIEGPSVAPDAIRRFLNVLSGRLGLELGHHTFHLDTELPAAPFQGARVRGWLPPLVEQPCFIIRKHAARPFTLEALADGGLLPAHQLPLLYCAVERGDNLLVVGGTRTGKTTLLGALLAHHAQACPTERLVVLEDTPELHLTHRDVLRVRTGEGYDLHALVKGTLRSAPDRIIVGEVRDRSALALLDAWATGHRGGMATLHASSAVGALRRLGRLVRRNNVPAEPELISEAIDRIIVLKQRPRAQGLWRYVHTIAALDAGGHLTYEYLDATAARHLLTGTTRAPSGPVKTLAH